ncbi:MAG: class I SAM-dependent methyltransferase [Actinobacteria bacterium]|nr:class I SAM-dependent methyltransferase [Actinomycetota bacterium]
MIEFLAELADGGPALELGIGTGRVAVPLAQTGVSVDGIELSEAMAERLEAKPCAIDIGVTIGDFATATVDREFSLAFVVFNTIKNLTTQEAQVACFQNVADHLSPGGYFVIEVLVPMLRSLHPGQNLLAHHMSENKWDVDEYRFATQTSTSHHYSVRDGELIRNSVPFRYVWPEELDLMAKLAGMERCQRWGGWNREPFTDDSTFHVSVWQKPRV